MVRASVTPFAIVGYRWIVDKVTQVSQASSMTVARYSPIQPAILCKILTVTALSFLALMGHFSVGSSPRRYAGGLRSVTVLRGLW